MEDGFYWVQFELGGALVIAERSEGCWYSTSGAEIPDAEPAFVVKERLVPPRHVGDDELPGITTAEVTVLCQRWSLVDLCRVVLAKAGGLGGGGLSTQGAATMDVSTGLCKLTLKRLVAKRVSKKRASG